MEEEAKRVINVLNSIIFKSNFLLEVEPEGRKSRLRNNDFTFWIYVLMLFLYT